jgi:hypothetical protein
MDSNYKQKAEHLYNRLMSSDCSSDECVDAAVFIREIVSEFHGPDGFKTWKDAAVDERIRRVKAEVALAARGAFEVRDGCKLCLGSKGGVPGNENVIGGVVVCDYCSSTLIDMKKVGWFGHSIPLNGEGVFVNTSVTLSECLITINAGQDLVCNHGTRGCVMNHSSPKPLGITYINKGPSL